MSYIPNYHTFSEAVASSALALLALTLSLSFAQEQPDAPRKQNLLVFGDSLTAGNGVDYDQAYPSILQSLLDAENLAFEVIPSGVSGETTAGGLRRINWVMRLPIDVFVLALGGNDGLRGIDLEDTKRNLLSIGRRVKAKNPSARIVIAGMLMPPNLGERYTNAFAALYPEVAEELDALLIPFLLEGVAGDSELNLADGIHPNPEGHRRVAQHVFESLKPLLEDRR